MKKIAPLLVLVFFILNSGCKKSDTDPIASFSISNYTPCVDEFVTFSSTSTNAHHVRWTFPDGSTASSNTISYSFDRNGLYSVKLEAFNKAETVSDYTVDDVSVCVSGKVVFYTDSLGYKAPIDILMNNDFAGTITSFVSNIPNCGQPGAVTVEICPGIYTYSATNGFKTWQNSVKITANNCIAIKLN
ncbi:MAG: PKD domain-containing protein [Bacteroidia bacterium]|nr:PKD domain-containing protein [Bacteroidia bacterium]MCF8447980.1 PKD domain-containing protein [Bacteroidia bacterium]